MDVDSDSAEAKRGRSKSTLSRRNLIKQSGKALYIAPTLTMLGSLPASAQFGSPPPPPGSAGSAAPAAPVPTE